MLKKGLITLVAVLLALGTFIVPASPAEAAKSTRVAEVLEVEGDAYITKNGGSKQFRLFRGMTLNQGDFLVTGPGAKVVLLLGDRGDEVVVAENSSLYLSELSASDAGTKSKLKIWAGSLWNKVKALAGAEDEFEVETPTAVMGVRGTHFIIVIDPLTGLPKMILNSGKVETVKTDGSEGKAVVLPTQQITVYPDYDPQAGIEYFDPEELAQNVSADIIAHLLKNKADIDRENDELLDSLGESDESPEGATLSLTEQEALDRYRNNLENALHHVLKMAAEAGALTEEMVQQIVDEANRQIQDATRQYQLDRDVPPIDPTAALDPEEEAFRRQLREEAEERRRKKLQEKEERREELQQNNQDLLNQIQQKRNEQEQANQQAEEQEKEEAVDRYSSSLTEEQRQLLEQRLRERKEEAEQQREAAERKRQQSAQQEETPAAPPSGGGSGGSGGSGPGGGGAGKAKVSAEIRDIADVTWLHVFKLAIDVDESDRKLYAAEVHVTVPEAVRQGPLPEGQPQYNLESAVFGEETAVSVISDNQVLVNGEQANEIIYAAMIKPGLDGVQVGGKINLVSIPMIYFHYNNIVPFDIQITIILLDEEGNVITVDKLDALTADFSEDQTD